MASLFSQVTKPRRTIKVIPHRNKHNSPTSSVNKSHMHLSPRKEHILRKAKHLQWETHPGLWAIIAILTYGTHIQTHHSNKTTMKGCHLTHKKLLAPPEPALGGSYTSMAFRVSLVTPQKIGLAHTGRYTSQPPCPSIVWTHSLGIGLPPTSSNHIAHVKWRLWRTTFATCQRRSIETSDHDADLTSMKEKEVRRIG